MRLPLYERDPYVDKAKAHILNVGLDDSGPYVVLDDTLFYPEGGGQPADRGFLGEVAVLDVQRREGEIRHYLAQPVEPGATGLRLDWARRFDHMQQHTGQHLLTALADARFGWPTTAFHLGESRCDVELAVPSLSAAELEALEEAIAAEIRAAHPIQARHVDAEAYATLPVRSRGLPEGHEGPIRLVEIQGLDLNTCGGTHLRSTAELEVVKLLGTEPLRGGTRLFFVAGRRARMRMEAHERRNAALRTRLGAPDEELVPVLEVRLEHLRQAERQTRALEEALAQAYAQAWAADSDLVQDHHLADRSAAFLGLVARAFVPLAPQKRLFLTGGDPLAFLVAAGPDSGVDLPNLGSAVAQLLEGKGGGKAPIYQGKAASLARREEAARAVRA